MLISEQTIVRTKDELKNAVKSGASSIIVKGDLAKKVHKSFKLSKVSKITIGLLTAAFAAAPFTGGVTVLAAAPIATLTGLEVALIVAVAFLGLGLVLSMIKEYKVVKVESNGTSVTLEK